MLTVLGNEFLVHNPVNVFLGDKSAPVCAFDLMHRLWVWTLRTILLEAADLWIIASETQVSPPVAILN